MATTCALTGSAAAAIDEEDVVNGGKEIILTLTDDTWHADVGTDCQETTDLIAGIDSAQGEPGGWDANVKANMAHGDITREVDNVTVTIELAAEEGYDITATETITATIPANALVSSGIAVEAAPTFTVGAVTGVSIPVAYHHYQHNIGI